MSYVSSVALFCPSFNNAENVGKVNEWLEGGGFGSLVEVSDHAGGRKGFEIEAHIGGFNWLVTYQEEFVKLVRSLPWYDPHEGALVIQSHEDDIETYPLREKPPVVDKVYADALAASLRRLTDLPHHPGTCPKALGDVGLPRECKCGLDDAMDALEVYDQVTRDEAKR